MLTRYSYTAITIIGRPMTYLWKCTVINQGILCMIYYILYSHIKIPHGPHGAQKMTTILQRWNGYFYGLTDVLYIYDIEYGQFKRFYDTDGKQWKQVRPSQYKEYGRISIVNQMFYILYFLSNFGFRRPTQYAFK